MKISKVNNKYIIRKMINYKSIRLSFDTKPTKQDIKKALTNYLQNGTAAPTTTDHLQQQPTMTLLKTIQDYITIKNNILSPSTIKGYYGTINTLKKYSPQLLQLDINNITNITIQQFINQYAINHTPKTCTNILSNIITPILFFNTNKHFKIKTPQKIKHSVYIPPKQDIELLKNYFATTDKDYESIFLLSLYGLRQSEIQALTINDLNTDTNTLTINKAKVKGYKNIYYIKTTKTIESTRQIIITDYLKNLILNQQSITLKNYNMFYKHLKLATQKLNIKYFNPHKLRHYFASEMHKLNIPSKYIMAMGGWATDNVLKNIYTHTIETETKVINNKINQLLFWKVEQIKMESINNNLTLIIKDNIIKTLYTNNYTPYQLKLILRIINLIILSNVKGATDNEK